MHNANIPDPTELPSSAQLIKSTIIAIIVAAVILVTVVLPAEYGIDPTGIGKLTGLKRMGEIKVALNEEAKAEEQAVSTESVTEETEPIAETSTEQIDTLTTTLAPNQSTEIKISMTQGTEVTFEWSTDVGEVFYDLHGDSPEVNYHIYEKGTSKSMQGTLTAEFTGSHGWYWKNRNQIPVTITITATGNYQQIKEMN
jgi:hypothetical protein